MGEVVYLPARLISPERLALLELQRLRLEAEEADGELTEEDLQPAAEVEAEGASY